MDLRFNLFPNGKTKALTMSYDDGVGFDRRLVGIFDKYGVRGTFHVNSGKLGKEGYLDASEIASLFANHEVSVHTVTHPHLEILPKTKILQEVLEDRRALEDLVGYPVRGMSYPCGTFNEAVVEMLPSLGIEYARTVVSHGKFTTPDDFLRWPATCHHSGNILELGQKFLDCKDRGMRHLMYVWGHSFEFERDNNWELIEDFCKLVSGSSEVWFATNIEIYDYIKALYNLKFSASGDIVYNPSGITVWISADGKNIEIPAGQTCRLL